MKILSQDEFYEQKYLDQLNLPQVIFQDTISAGTLSAASLQNKIEANEATLIRGTIPLLIVINLTLTMIILTVKSTIKTMAALK